jgi:membrane protein YqaA with SNARE-associated domain
VSSIVQSLYWFFARMGSFGLFGLGALDSFIFFIPTWVDILLVALVARDPDSLPLYVAMATSGSVVGSLLTDVVSRKGGEVGLAKHVPERRLQSVKEKVQKHAGKAVMVATLMPPPFPWKIVIAAAAALQYSRKRLLLVVAAGRALRFTIAGLLAARFGGRILKIAEHPAVEGFVIAIMAVSILAGIISLVGWLRHRGREERESGPAVADAAPGEQRV